jgi:hypothetical protein
LQVTELDHVAHLRIEARAGEAISRVLTSVRQKLGVAA